MDKIDEIEKDRQRYSYGKYLSRNGYPPGKTLDTLKKLGFDILSPNYLEPQEEYYSRVIATSKQKFN